MENRIYKSMSTLGRAAEVAIVLGFYWLGGWRIKWLIGGSSLLILSIFGGFAYQDSKHLHRRLNARRRLDPATSRTIHRILRAKAAISHKDKPRLPVLQ